MDDCIFCQIIKGEKPGYFVLKEKEYIAILDIFGSAPGHTMVVPIRHGYSILDFSEEELGKVMTGVKKVAEKQKKVFNADSITIGINHFEKTGVPHLHIHLIPRLDDDGGGFIQKVVKRPINEKMEDIAKKLAEA
jgi:histidine triad (HIT) family protein